jgi:hypothetical protein
MMGPEDHGVDADGRLSSVTANRKRAEEDVQLLANRIKHLKAEEERAMRKVQEVRAKTHELSAARERRAADQARRAARAEDVQRAESAKRGDLRRQDINREYEVRQKKEQRCLERGRAARTDRLSRAEELRRAAELEDGKQNALRARASSLRRSDFYAQHARARIAAERQEQARKTQEQRRLQDDRRVREASDALARMEQEEMAVLQRLQHSQQMYESACREYEVVRGAGSRPPSLGPPLTLPLPPAQRLTPRRGVSVPPLALGDAEKVRSAERRPGSTASTVPTAPSTRQNSAPETRIEAPAPLAAPLELPVDPPTPQPTITYKTMDGTVVTIPVVADLQAELDLAESLNRP